jgi:hypothetical protein
MLATNILMVAWLTASPEIQIQGQRECEDGTVFGPDMLSNRCSHPVGRIRVKFYESDGGYCAQVEDSPADCKHSCAAARQSAAMQADSIVANACQPLPTKPVDVIDIPVTPLRRPKVEPLPSVVSNLVMNLTIGHVTFVGGSSDPIGAGFQTGIGLMADGTHVAVTLGMVDVTRTDWFWRGGVELCRGGRYGVWEWNGCFGLGGGEFYTGQTNSREYPWVSFSNDLRVHLVRGLALRLGIGGQVAITDRRFGIPIDRQSKFSNVILFGIEYGIRLCAGKRGPACR